jgi:hypothetical protein
MPATNPTRQLNALQDSDISLWATLEGFSSAIPEVTLSSCSIVYEAAIPSCSSVAVSIAAGEASEAFALSIPPVYD